MTELTYQQVYLIGLPIVIVFILIEVLFSSLNNKKLYRKNDTLCTIGLLTGNILMVFLVKGITLAIHIYLYQYRILDLSSLIPIWMMWILAFVLIDLVFYFYHRVSHRSRFLWAVHMSHHSSEEMNFAVSFRQAWLGPISKIPFFIFLPIVGIDPTIGMRPYQATELAYGLEIDKINPKLIRPAAVLFQGLYEAFVNEDCSLVEINPLVLTGDGRVIALDSKITIDDNALFRHKDTLELRDLDEEDPAETEASENDLNYIRLDGSIGCMVNGAGLAMGTMDIIKACGGEPANFLDVGGGEYPGKS